MSHEKRKKDTLLTSWLLQNLEKSENGTIQLNEICGKLHHKYSGHKLGRLITKLFTGVICKTERAKSDWKKLTRVYMGIGWKEHDIESCTCNFEDIVKLVPGDFFPLEQSSEIVKLGYFNGTTINGNKLLMEVSFNSSGVWEAVVCGKTIQLKHLNISNQFSFDKNSVNGVCEIVKQFKLCAGIDAHETKYDILYSESAIKEYRSNKNSTATAKIRSELCKIVVPFNSLFQVCEICRKLVKSETDEMEDEENVKNDENVLLTAEDNDNMTKILNSLLETVPEKMKLFLKSQIKSAQSVPYARRWDKQIIRLCLTLYCRSPRAYQDVQKSGFIMLPSKRLIQYYKNQIQQEPGINKSILYWMKNEAEIKNIPKEGYEGGLMIDEMSIQEDLQMRKRGEDFELVGFTECTEESLSMNKLMSGTDNTKLANHVLQLVFLGHTGFRFPIAHFPTCQASASELYLIFWKAVKSLALYGFTITYLSLDGAQCNRDLMKIFTAGKSSDSMDSMMIDNLFDRSKPKICIIMDYSHVMKKIRNNITKSGHSQTHTRLMVYEGQHIIWEHWIKAYQWDVSSNPFKVHHHLTMEHFFLNSQSKMRNKLAEDVMNEDMLHLMQCYKKSLGEKGEHLNSSIELLKQTSVLTKVFRDARPLRDYSDDRLQQLRNVLMWFRSWESSVNENTKLKKEKEKCLISFQTREDIVSLLLGFDELCKNKFKSSASSIIPNRINSDVIENIFSQQRGLHNGCNTNPTYLTYSRTMNTIILGETSISRKSNTGNAVTGAEMFKPDHKSIKAEATLSRSKYPLKPLSISNVFH